MSKFKLGQVAFAFLFSTTYLLCILIWETFPAGRPAEAFGRTRARRAIAFDRGSSDPPRWTQVGPHITFFFLSKQPYLLPASSPFFLAASFLPRNE